MANQKLSKTPGYINSATNLNALPAFPSLDDWKIHIDIFQANFE